MGKQGPCCHCGVTSTPLWRNGPIDKPVLCNACGSRWRTKGTLLNYTPLHLRAEPDEFEDSKTLRVRKMFMKKKRKNETTDVHKLKLNHDDLEMEAFDEDRSNRSSSGSAVSNSDSCTLFGSTTDESREYNNTVFDMIVPSKKRSRILSRPKSSPVEKLTKDLYKILQEQQASCMSGISEEDDVLLETNQPTVSVEIGHGSVLIRHPSSIARDEESEASSLSVDNKLVPVNEAYSRLKTLPVYNNDNTVVNIPISGIIEKNNKIPSLCNIQQDQSKRELLEKLQMLGHHNSPLRYVDLKDVVNFDVFLNCLSSDEQIQMHKYLPRVDISRPLESIQIMFESPQFKETLSSFQKLLGEGVFDNSLSGVTIEDCRKLQRLLLCSLVKSKWIQQYTTLKGPKSEGITPMTETAAVYNNVATCHSVNVTKLRDGQCQKFQGARNIPESPKRPIVKINPTTKDDPTKENGSGFSPRNHFTEPSDNNSTVGLNSLWSTDGGSYQDLLIDIPSYSSFPQAELLYPTLHPRLLRP